MAPNPLTPPPSAPCSPRIATSPIETSATPIVEENNVNDAAVTDGSLTVVEGDEPDRDPESMAETLCRASTLLTHFRSREATIQSQRQPLSETSVDNACPIKDSRSPETVGERSRQ